MVIVYYYQHYYLDIFFVGRFKLLLQSFNFNSKLSLQRLLFEFLTLRGKNNSVSTTGCSVTWKKQGPQTEKPVVETGKILAVLLNRSELSQTGFDAAECSDECLRPSNMSSNRDIISRHRVAPTETYFFPCVSPKLLLQYYPNPRTKFTPRRCPSRAHANFLRHLSRYF